MNCQSCINYKECLERGDKDTHALTEGVEHLCRGYTPLDLCQKLVNHIGETVYKICPKCNDRHDGSCENCAWATACFSNGCTVFGKWEDGQYPAEKCTIVPKKVYWNFIPTIAANLGKKIFFSKAEAEAVLEKSKKGEIK